MREAMRIRPTARVLLIDEQQRLLLFHIHDKRALHPAYPDMRVYWITPGGGVDAGESFEETALRELWEEAGIRINTLGACVWLYERILQGDHGRILLQERFFIAHISTALVSFANMLSYEQESHRAYHWWTRTELLQAQDAFLPPNLPELMQPLFDGAISAQPIIIPLADAML